MAYRLTLIIGLILLAIAALILQRRLLFLNTGAKTIATVVDFELVNNRARRNSQSYRAVFSFITETNQIIKKKVHFGRTTRWYIGHREKIVYNRQHPHNSFVLIYPSTFASVIILTFIALPLIIIGAGYFLAQKFFTTI